MKNTTAIILLVLSVGLFYVFTMPYYGEVRELSAAARGYQNILDNLSDIALTRDRLLLDYEKIPKSEITRLSKVLPENVETVRLAQELDTIAARYGIALSSVRVDTEKGLNASTVALPGYNKPYNKTTVGVSFISNYQNFRRLLADLERSLRLMDVRSLSFQTGETGLYEHELSIETYWLKTQASEADETLVKTVTELSNVNFNPELFASPGYRLLTDFSANIPAEPASRPNPFDVIGRD